MIERYIRPRNSEEEPETDPQKGDNYNTLGDVYQSVKRAILTVTEDEEDASSPPLFRHVAVDTGQYERLLSGYNTEYETPFPACFVRFTNVHFLVAQQHISEGRGILRIRYVLNRLDNQHVDFETYAFRVAERLNQAIQRAKLTERPLQERCNLLYFDMPQSTNMLQAYWLDYELYFTDTSSWKYADWIAKRVITPPFTNHSDVPNDIADVEHPTYDEATDFDDLIVGAESMQIGPNIQKIGVGESLVLKVTFTPANTTDKSVTFETDNPDIATVTPSGIVTGLSPGVAHLTATASNGVRSMKRLTIYLKPQ